MDTNKKPSFEFDGTGPSVFVLGWQFGPCILVERTTCEDALDAFSDNYGEAVSADDSALGDYDGETIEERTESAMSAGDIRVTGQGSTVWVDPYEWIREFASVEAALEAFSEYPSFVSSVEEERKQCDIN